MWKRKTNQEIWFEKEQIKRLRRQNNLKKSAQRFVYAFFGILFFSIVKALIFDPELDSYRSGLSKPIGISELREYIFIYVLISLVLSAIVFFVSLLIPQYFNRNINTTVICKRCYHTKIIDNNTRCECGGSYACIDFYTWFEDRNVDTSDDESWIYKYKVMKNEA